MVSDAAPQPLDERVVSPRISAVHADRDAVLDEQAGDRGASAGTLLGLNRMRAPSITVRQIFKMCARYSQRPPAAVAGRMKTLLGAFI